MCATHREKEANFFCLVRTIDWFREKECLMCVCVAFLFHFGYMLMLLSCSYTHVSQSSSGSQKLQFLCFSSGERAKEIIVPLVPNNIFVSVCVAAKNAASLYPTLAFFGSEWVTRRNSILSSERARIEFAQVHTPQRWKSFRLCECASLKHQSFDTCAFSKHELTHFAQESNFVFQVKMEFGEKNFVMPCYWSL